MSKLILSLLGFLLLPHLSKSQNVVQVPIDIKESEVHWKGTKMRGMGKHEGIVQIKSGYFETLDGTLYGGKIVLDMSTIMVTDIPEHEPVPRRRLNNHLKSDDFFGVEEYPEAEFIIKKIMDQNDYKVTVEGELSIRDVTDKITVLLDLVKQNSEIKTITSTFQIDRYNWNIGYTGSWLDRTLVDKEIKLNLLLKAED